MKCPSCDSHVIGADCPKCAVPTERACPDCHERFLCCEYYCRSCGRELRFVNFSNHTVLRRPAEIRVEQYEHPADREARRVMAGLWPIKVIARYGIEKFSQPTLLGTLLGSTVKVTNRQFPVIKRAIDVCLCMLQMRDVEVFITRSTLLSASSHGVGGRTFIVVTSGLVENLDYDELLFVLGRELGHIKSDHTLYLSILSAAMKGIDAIPMVGTTLHEVVDFVLLPWQRSSQLTADRAGLICCQSVQIATKALTKLALGSRELFETVDLDEFLRQYQDLQSEGAWGEYMQVNPFVLTRIRKLQGFIESPAWYRLMHGAYHPHRPSFDCGYCNGRLEVTDFDRNLHTLRCCDCGRAIHVEEVFCPHCGTNDRLDGRDCTLAKFTCSACHRPYFLNDERTSADAWNAALPADSWYSILQVPFNATPEHLARGYVAAMKPRDGSSPCVLRRIAIDRAYRTLLTTRSRMRHDASIRHRQGLSLLTNVHDDIVECHQCGVDSSGTFCGHCGARLDGSERCSSKMPPETTALSLHLAHLKKALIDERAFGSGIVVFCDPPFDACFKTSPDVFHFAFARESFTAPGVIRRWIEECNRRSEVLTRKSWLHATATFVLILLGDVDDQLCRNLATQLFVGHRGIVGSFQLEIVTLEAPDSLRCIVGALGERNPRVTPSTAYSSFQDFCTALATRTSHQPV